MPLDEIEEIAPSSCSTMHVDGLIHLDMLKETTI